MLKLNLKTDPMKHTYYVLRDIQNLDSDPYQARSGRHARIWSPPTDVFETEVAVVVRVEIAGMLEADFTIMLDGRHLTIRGTRPDVLERRAYHQMEIRFGEFSSEIELPSPVDIEQVEAVYNNGFLRVTLPKSRPQQIKIE